MGRGVEELDTNAISRRELLRRRIGGAMNVHETVDLEDEDLHLDEDEEFGGKDWLSLEIENRLLQIDHLSNADRMILQNILWLYLNDAERDAIQENPEFYLNEKVGREQLRDYLSDLLGECIEGWRLETDQPLKSFRDLQERRKKVRSFLEENGIDDFSKGSPGWRALHTISHGLLESDFDIQLEKEDDGYLWRVSLSVFEWEVDEVDPDNVKLVNTILLRDEGRSASEDVALLAAKQSIADTMDESILQIADHRLPLNAEDVKYLLEKENYLDDEEKTFLRDALSSSKASRIRLERYLDNLSEDEKKAKIDKSIGKEKRVRALLEEGGVSDFHETTEAYKALQISDPRFIEEDYVIDVRKTEDPFLQSEGLEYVWEIKYSDYGDNKIDGPTPYFVLPGEKGSPFSGEITAQGTADSSDAAEKAARAAVQANIAAQVARVKENMDNFHKRLGVLGHLPRTIKGVDLAKHVKDLSRTDLPGGYSVISGVAEKAINSSLPGKLLAKKSKRRVLLIFRDGKVLPLADMDSSSGVSLIYSRDTEDQPPDRISIWGRLFPGIVHRDSLRQAKELIKREALKDSLGPTSS